MQDDEIREKIEFVQQHLKDFRRLCNITSYALADYLDVSRQTISNIENGRIQLSKCTFLAIKSFFRENSDILEDAENLIKYLKE